MNSVNMTQDSYWQIFKNNLQPLTFIFFGLSPFMVWGLNKAIYDQTGQNFWYMGTIMGAMEFFSYLAAAFLFYRKLPNLKESIAFVLILVALIIAGKD